ncbi:unnamed protein product [Polarella glacialis]|uniref:Uncharacterized protein n=1 Tax=Polarella glacialis TaxID=89957 RepID=A0A813JN69_POLGL|nr:unnamed protein product [Polarella glacialis]
MYEAIALASGAHTARFWNTTSVWERCSLALCSVSWASVPQLAARATAGSVVVVVVVVVFVLVVVVVVVVVFVLVFVLVVLVVLVLGVVVIVVQWASGDETLLFVAKQRESLSELACCHTLANYGEVVNYA